MACGTRMELDVGGTKGRGHPKMGPLMVSSPCFTERGSGLGTGPSGRRRDNGPSVQSTPSAAPVMPATDALRANQTYLSATWLNVLRLQRESWGGTLRKGRGKSTAQRLLHSLHVLPPPSPDSPSPSDCLLAHLAATTRR